MSKREKDFRKRAELFADETRDTAEEKYQTRHDYLAGEEYGYQYVRKNLWYDAQGDTVPEYGREVIVIGRDGKVFYGHRPDPKEVTMIDGKPYYAKTYGKNGWNWDNIALWLDVEVPYEMVDKIVSEYFKENEQKRDSE